VSNETGLIFWPPCREERYSVKQEYNGCEECVNSESRECGNNQYIDPCTLSENEPLQLVVVDVEVLQLRPDPNVLGQLLEPIVGRLEAASMFDELLVLQDLLGQLLYEYRVERHVERFDVLLPADHALGDVAAQLRRQCDHLAAGTHRRDRFLILFTTHRPAALQSIFGQIIVLF